VRRTDVLTAHGRAGAAGAGMPGGRTEGWTASRAGRALRSAVPLVTLALLSACAAAGNNPMTMFADPGKYEFYDCEQLAAQRKHWSGREQELKQLMDRAGQSAGGSVVNLLAYRADHVAAREELVVVENAARAKNCDTPGTWRSNSAVQ
jgi:hypothetical protein